MGQCGVMWSHFFMGFFDLNLIEAFQKRGKVQIKREKTEKNIIKK